MKTQVRFRCARFTPVADEAEEGAEGYINPGRFARRLADFLTAGLARHGLAVRRDVVEDWGIRLELDLAGPVAFAVCCGNVEDDEHLVFTEPGTPRLRRWFRTTDVTPQLTALVGALDAILRAEDDITALEWEAPG